MTAKKTNKKTKTRALKPTLQMRVSQGAVARTASRNIELLYKKMNLSPKSVKADKQRLLGTASAPIKLIEEVAAASDQHGTLIGMAFDSNKAREALAFSAAFEPVATKAEAFAQRVRDAIIMAKGDVGSAALAAYASMKGIVRRPGGAPLRDSFDKMAQIMRDRRKTQTLASARKSARAAKAAAAKALAPAVPVAAPPAATTAPAAADKHSASTTVVITPPVA